MHISRRSLLQGGLIGSAAASSPIGALAGTSNDALNFLVIGDWGKPQSEGQRQIASVMTETARNAGCRFVVSTGDNFYPQGVASSKDPIWGTAFESVYNDPALMCPWYPVLGNHDHKGNVQAQINYSSLSSRWSMPASYFRHTDVVGGRTLVEFFFLDTTTMTNKVTNALHSFFNPGAKAQVQWLDNSLGASRAKWKIVVGHHPIVSCGPHQISQPLVGRIKPLLEKHGVNAYINGHDHNLQHIVENNVHYLTSGSGAQAHPVRSSNAAQFYSSSLGFIHARVSHTFIEAEFIDDESRVLYDVSIAALT